MGPKGTEGETTRDVEFVAPSNDINQSPESPREQSLDQRMESYWENLGDYRERIRNYLDQVREQLDIIKAADRGDLQIRIAKLERTLFDKSSELSDLIFTSKDRQDAFNPRFHPGVNEQTSNTGQNELDEELKRAVEAEQAFYDNIRWQIIDLRDIMLERKESLDNGLTAIDSIISTSNEKLGNRTK